MSLIVERREGYFIKLSKPKETTFFAPISSNTYAILLDIGIPRTTNSVFTCLLFGNK